MLDTSEAELARSFGPLLDPPFSHLRKRAESLLRLEAEGNDPALLRWDAAPVGSPERLELLALDAIVAVCFREGLGSGMAAAHLERVAIEAHACPVCWCDVEGPPREVSTSERVGRPSPHLTLASHLSQAGSVVDGADHEGGAGDGREQVHLVLHGPCYHRVCYNCLVGRALLPIRRLRSETGRSEANLEAELRRVTEAGLLSCHKCRATIAWPWGFLGPYSKRQRHGSERHRPPPT